MTKFTGTYLHPMFTYSRIERHSPTDITYTISVHGAVSDHWFNDELNFSMCDTKLYQDHVPAFCVLIIRKYNVGKTKNYVSVYAPYYDADKPLSTSDGYEFASDLDEHKAIVDNMVSTILERISMPCETGGEILNPYGKKLLTSILRSKSNRVDFGEIAIRVKDRHEIGESKY